MSYTVTTKPNRSQYDCSADFANTAFDKGYSYLIRKNGDNYEAVSGATGRLVYGGSDDEGGVDGSDDAAVIAAVLAAVSSGVVLLNGVAFDLTQFGDIPEDVQVHCSYNAEYHVYINSADSSGSPYTVSVGSGVNNGYYLAQDSQKRVCFASTNATSLLATINALPTTSHIIFTSGTFNFDSPVTITKGKLSGQGTSTSLFFAPSTPETSGLILKGFYISVSDMAIRGNENVTNIVHVQPNGQKGWLQNLFVIGTNPITSGQVGLFFDGSIPAVYEYKTDNCEFDHCDIGIKLTGYSNAQFISNINIQFTNLGISMDSDMNMVNNVFHQTPTVAVLRLTANSYANQIVNVYGESNTCPTLILDAGSRYNTIGSVINTGSGGGIQDDSGYAQTIKGAAYIASNPAVSTSDVRNTFGGNALVEITVGGTATRIVKNNITYKSSVSNITCYVIVGPGERLRVNQTTGVSWVWRGLP